MGRTLVDCVELFLIENIGTYWTNLVQRPQPEENLKLESLRKEEKKRKCSQKQQKRQEQGS